MAVGVGGPGLATGDHAPQRFAGILGQAGNLDDRPLDAANFRNLPTLIAGAPGT